MKTLRLEMRGEDGGRMIHGAGARWLACVAVATSLVACTGGGSNSEGSTSAVPPSNDVYSIAVVASTVGALPKCTSSLAGTTAYVQSPSSLYSCLAGNWVQIPCATILAGAVAYASASQTLLACVSGQWTQVPLPQGPQGPKGASGDAGPPGPKGATGATGATGPAGPTGPKGDAGAVGPAGPQGSEGPAGPMGATGATGATGVGTQGSQGNAGTNSLISVTPIAASSTQCPAGGEEIQVGLDINGNGTLDSNESTTIAYVCNGAPGTPSQSSDAGTGGGAGAPSNPGVDAAAGSSGDAGSPSSPDASGPAVCGNGVIEPGEQCDDGNTNNLDGCDSTCRYEAIYRMTNFTLQGTAVPASLFCAFPANRLGAQVFTSTGLGQVNASLSSTITSAASNVMIQLVGLNDLSGGSASNLSIGLFSASPDPARGAWPGGSPIDWWFLGGSGLAPNGVPANLLNGSVAARNMNVGPGVASLSIALGGSPTNLEMIGARVAATLNGTPAPDVPESPPAQLAPGLVVFQTMSGNGAGQGLCGGVTVDSLAQTPIPSSLAGGGSTACEEGYTGCAGGSVDNCNSLLDVIVGGCKVLMGLVTVVNPALPDIPSNGMTVQMLIPGASGKVPAGQTVGNTDAYSSYWHFTANRAHVTGRRCTSTADCQPGMTCSGGVCR